MTEQRRTASPLVFLAFGLGLLGLVLCVVPWTQAFSRNEYVGRGSTSISQRSLEAPPEGASAPASPNEIGRGVLAKGKRPSAPRSLRNPYNTNVRGGDIMDWTYMPDFATRKFSVLVGNVSGLFPGSTVPLPVTFVNGQDFDLLVESATVTATGTASCGAANLKLTTVTYSTPVQVSAGSTRSQSIPFGLLASAPDSCQGATFTVTVTAKATSA